MSEPKSLTVNAFGLADTNASMLSTRNDLKGRMRKSSFEIEVLEDDNRGQMLQRRGRPLQGRTFRVWNKLASTVNWETIIVIGANYGEMIFFSDIRRDQRIISIEPNLNLKPCLRNNLKSFSNVTFLECAIADRSGEFYLKVDVNHSGKSSLSESQTNQIVRAMTITKLLDLASGPNILVKVDIEGGEIQILPSICASSKANIVFFIETQSFGRTEYMLLLQYFTVFCIDSNLKPIWEITDRNCKNFLQSSLKGRNCILVPIHFAHQINIEKLRPFRWFVMEVFAGVRYILLERFKVIKLKLFTPDARPEMFSA